MDNDWRDCINIDQHLHMMTIKANISHFVSNAILSFSAFVAVFYILGEYAIRFLFLSEYNNTERQLPVKIQLPFDSQQSPIFEFIVVALFLHVLLQICMFCTLNGLILTLVLHVSGQIDIMCHEFRNISKSALLHKSTISLFQVQIERHNRIISFSENVQKLFSFIALMQVVYSTLVICCLGFFIIISIHNESGILVLVKTILAYLAIMVESFIICFAGEYLSSKGKLIANATYDTLWYDMPSHHSKIIIFIIMRSQKRLAITAGKMMDMSFEAFSSIVKASASYISVLNAMY
ncbi:PREDICTED: odorant receptor 22c-like [Vollenhovia emeryi]|uniref:odorant receptor 22c-like n=1 Tax=Vollenhovia emeryi TaxID=411798 RepID=UPI0005F5557D|nr:PREDICTED: odorant receptor 22c-like [Vollenhovia emeryi]